MAALIIGADERAKIAELKAFAAAQPPRDVHGTQAAADADRAAFRDAMRDMTVFLPSGFAVCYTREIQPHAPPPGLCHHISISVDRPGEVPTPAAVDMILEEFGMRSIERSDDVWVEDIGPGERAINVLQLIAD